MVPSEVIEDLGRKDISVAQFRYMRDSPYEATSYIKKMLSTMCVHKVVEAHRNLHKKEDCLIEFKAGCAESLLCMKAVESSNKPHFVGCAAHDNKY